MDGAERPYLEPRAVCVNRPGDRPLFFPLYTDRTYTFGRTSEADVSFTSDSVSRVHGRLSYRADGRWVYRDLGSTNGSFLSEFPFENEAEQWLPLRTSLDHPVSAGQAVLLAKGGRLTLLAELPPAAAVTCSEGKRSLATEQLDDLVLESALHRMPLLLVGPMGSGKTYLARRIHELSGVKGPFEAVNCGALAADANTLRSELLGHVSGGFTGAVKARVGKLRHADGGTVFLDEVESMPAEAQQFLLDILDGNGNFSPLGAPADWHEPAPRFRLISASKQQLKKSRLREDLAHRLSRGATIRVPTLEERKDDIPALVDTFVQRLSDEQQVVLTFTVDAVRVLQERRWPGHVRELEGIVTSVAERAIARARLKRQRDAAARSGKTQQFSLEELRRQMAQQSSAEARPEGPIEIGAALIREHLDQHAYGLGLDDETVVEVPPPGPARIAARGMERRRPADYTREELEEALARNAGVYARTAAELGMVVNTLKAHLERHGLRVKPGLQAPRRGGALKPS